MEEIKKKNTRKKKRQPPNQDCERTTENEHVRNGFRKKTPFDPFVTVTDKIVKNPKQEKKKQIICH